MKRDLCTVFLLGCLLILLLEGPRAISSVSEDLKGPYVVPAEAAADGTRDGLVGARVTPVGTTSGRYRERSRAESWDAASAR